MVVKPICALYGRIVGDNEATFIMYYRTAKYVKRGQRFECLEVYVREGQKYETQLFEPTPEPDLYIRVHNPKEGSATQVYFRLKAFVPSALVTAELFRLFQFLMEPNWRGRVGDYDLIVSNVF